jgi:hypothetical protein
MSSPKFSNLLIYVTVFLVGGLIANNYFDKEINTELTSIEEEQQSDYEEERESVTIFNRASFDFFESSYKNYPKKIFVNISGGQELISVIDIVYCESTTNSKDLGIVLANGDSILAKRTTLKSIKEEIRNAPFLYNALNAYIINFEHVNKILQHEGRHNKTAYTYEIIMDNGSNISLPKKQRDIFVTNVKRYFQ